jgi:hypothetical protein
MELVRSSGINIGQALSIQTICVDNEQIKQRIVDNSDIAVNTVPCLLLAFPDGGIEKYDGISLFKWFQQSISKYNRPSQQQIEKMKWEKQKQKEQEELAQRRKKLEEEEVIQRKKLSEKPISSTGKTSINDLPMEEEEEEGNQNSSMERYRNHKPVGQLRENSGNYTRSEEAFKGEKVNTRVHQRNVIKNTTKGKGDIMSRAKEMAKSREQVSNFPKKRVG